MVLALFFFLSFSSVSSGHGLDPTAGHHVKNGAMLQCVFQGVAGMGSRYRLARRPKLTDRIWISAGWACRARHCAAAAWKTTAMGVAWSKFSFLAPPWLRLFVLLGVLLLGRDVDFTWRITHQKYLMANKDFKSLQLRIESFVYALFFSLQLGK